MNCTDCPYYKTKCEYGAEHIICSKTIKNKQNEKKEVKTSHTKKPQ